MESLTAMERGGRGRIWRPAALERAARTPETRSASPPPWEAREASAAGEAAAGLTGVRGMTCYHNGLSRVVSG